MAETRDWLTEVQDGEMCRHKQDISGKNAPRTWVDKGSNNKKEAARAPKYQEELVGERVGGQQP